MSDVQPNLERLLEEREKPLHKYFNKIFRIDEHTNYYLDDRNRFIVIKNSVREKTENESDKGLEVIKYTKKNLEEFYETSRDLKLVVTDGKYIVTHEENNMLFIPLCNRYKNIVEYACSEFTNFDKLCSHSFSRIITKNNKIYVQSSQKTGNKYMQEIIFGRKAMKGHKLDHKYSNGLDNRSSMIRELTDSQNSANKEKVSDKNNQSKHKGVSKCGDKWSAIFSEYYIASYENEIDAAKAWNVYAVDKYRNTVPLNKDDAGNDLLSKIEIEDILKNGIPQEYIKKEKPVRDLPKNIGKEGSLYYYQITRNKKYYYKSFKTLEETEEKLEELKRSFETEKQIKQENLENDIDDYRNKAGFAVIRTRDKKGNINGVFEVDDEDWYKYIHWKWSRSFKYACGIVDGEKWDLHLFIYRDMDPDYYENIKDGKTVDHTDGDESNCRRVNLKLATFSQQQQNRRINKKSLFPYTGIIIQNGKFYTQCKIAEQNIRKGPFKFLEDAAQMYNSIVLEHDKNARINLIDDSKQTTINDIYDKENLSLEIIDSICSIKEMHAIFTINKDWRKEGKVILSKMLVEDIEKYKNIAKSLLMQE